MKTETLPLYANRSDVTLTSYLLDDSAEMLCGQSRPGILVCPGGGYMTVSDREAEPIALRYAAMGYHAFVLRYSVYSEGKNLFDIASVHEPKPMTQFPVPMRDIGRAMLTLRAHAEEWRLDAEQIALSGFSAGAHNCAMYAVYYDKPEIAGYLGAEAALLRPAACVLGYGLYDYHKIMRVKNGSDPFAVIMRNSSAMAFLGTREPDDALLDAVSPALHICASTPPMFLWATAGDTLVPAEQTGLMAAALSLRDVPFETHVFENGPHGLALGTQATASSRFELNADAAQWSALAERWLSKHLSMPLRERPVWMDMMEEGKEEHGISK